MQRQYAGGPSIETEMVLDCMVYIPMLLHPLLFLLLQPEYRQGLRDILKSCGSGSSSPRESPYGTGKKLAPPAPIIKPGGNRFRRNNNNGQLMVEQQPMIVPMGGGGTVQPQRPYPKPMPGYTTQGSAYIQPQGAYIPLQPLPQQQQQQKLPSPQSQPLLDNSFDEPQDPNLPPRSDFLSEILSYAFLSIFSVFFLYLIIS